jgi:Xaa-Pro aminopeptidase
MTTTPMTTMTLPPMDHAARVARLRAALADNEGDALLVTNLKNIRYLTGFTGSAGMLLVAGDALLLTSDGRYGSQIAEQVTGLAGLGLEVEIGLPSEQRDALKSAAKGFWRVGLEATHVTWAEQRDMAADWFAEVVPTMGVVERLRQVKDEGEVARIHAAASIADAALANVAGMLGEGPTEEQFGLALDTEMRRLGAAGTSFETIVGAGPNGAMPHHRPGPRRIERGDLVVLDFGALVDGYCSDMTRTVAVGEPREPALSSRMYEVVRQSQQAGVDAVRAGASGVDVDRACRDVIGAAGWADRFVHGTGHGVGLDIHEAPAVGVTSADTLAAGNVVTVEPGVYIPDHGGVRIEDTVVVTADGCRVLTSSPKELVLQ